jgi:hypothetical protein
VGGHNRSYNTFAHLTFTSRISIGVNPWQSNGNGHFWQPFLGRVGPQTFSLRAKPRLGPARNGGGHWIRHQRCWQWSMKNKGRKATTAATTSRTSYFHHFDRWAWILQQESKLWAFRWLPDPLIWVNPAMQDALFQPSSVCTWDSFLDRLAPSEAREVEDFHSRIAKTGQGNGMILHIDNRQFAMSGGLARCNCSRRCGLIILAFKPIPDETGSETRGPVAAKTRNCRHGM